MFDDLKYYQNATLGDSRFQNQYVHKYSSVLNWVSCSSMYICIYSICIGKEHEKQWITQFVRTHHLAVQLSYLHTVYYFSFIIMSNDVMRFGIKHWEPDVNPCAQKLVHFSRTKECRRPGWVIEKLYLILKTLNIHYELIDAGNMSSGGFDFATDQWSGLFRMVIIN